MIHLILLPGIILHELSHFLVGLLLGAKPTNFSIIPNKQKGSAGEVTFRNVNSFNALPIGLAPVFGGLLGLFYLYINYYLIFDKLSIIEIIITVYLGIVFFKTMLPSKQDIKVAFSYPLGIIFYGSLIFILLYLN